MALSGHREVVSLTRPDGRIPIVRQISMWLAEFQGTAGSSRIADNGTFGGTHQLVRKGHSFGSQMLEEFLHEFHGGIRALF
jgi:hypothetical protein